MMSHSRTELTDVLNNVMVEIASELVDIVADYAYFQPVLTDRKQFAESSVRDLESLLESPKSIFGLTEDKMCEFPIETITISLTQFHKYFMIVLSPHLSKWSIQFIDTHTPWVQLYSDTLRHKSALDLKTKLSSFLDANLHTNLSVKIEVPNVPKNVKFMYFSKKWFDTDHESWIFTTFDKNAHLTRRYDF